VELPDRIGQLRDMISIKVVYGDPIERDGVTVIPAAIVVGGGGGGGGQGPEGSGEGIGYGLWARPIGAYVIRDGNVRWEPAIDPMVVLMAAWIGLRTLRSLLRWYRSRQ
jgi:uncharacterized spore protein YtfJ